MLRAEVGTIGRETDTFSDQKWQGLYDRRARHQDPQQIPRELERAILSIRHRLHAHAHAAPATFYCLIGATAIRAEIVVFGSQLN
jgi:hypothetical protein